METAYSGNRVWVESGWSMSNAWPAFETYTWTGNKEIKKSLDELFANEGDDKKERSWNRYRRLPRDASQSAAADHGVRFCESAAPWALGYLWTGDRRWLDAALGWHDMIEQDCMQPTGVPVFDEFYGPTGAFRGTETCAVAAYMWSQSLLLSIGGQGRMGDRIERAFFNAAPATVARDFKTHAYFHSPNRMADKSLPSAGQYSFQAKHHPLCCTAAVNRMLPNYVTHMWMATYDNGLAAVQYGPCKVSALAADRIPVEIVCRTDYPFNEVIDMSVNPAREASFPLSLRIPGWCENLELSVNGSGVDAAPDANRFVRIQRRWKPGDSLRVRFPMSVRVTSGRDRNAQDAPYASISYGPLLFALPIPDTHDPNTHDPAARWNYALDVHGEKPGTDIRVERLAMPEKWDWPLASPLKLRAKGVAIRWSPEPEAPRLPAGPIAQHGTAEPVTLIPFGCTKFRVSMFPTTERAFRLSKPEKSPQRSGK